jgi:glycosyltransferase involved in cell wall biosynthesis
MSPFSPVLLVPHYDHAPQFARALPGLLAEGVPILVVDDGSAPAHAEALRTLATEHGFELVRHETNRGKGAAVMTGFDAAAARGYTHAFQVDADGQHDPADLHRFLDAARARPDTIVCGAPVFGEDAPWVRRQGRKLTDLVVFLETWKRGIRDSLCGFRVYPLAPVRALLARDRPGPRMEFDAEMLVLATWAGVPLHFLDSRVVYPPDGASHFHYLRDNARMVFMHVRLMLRMLLRAPRLAVDRATGRAGSVT